ncbi:hypothetical protein GCM10009836_21080 [Pseudonocardia ailaonensis]|uniref:Uncharacterized protein n=1 Tax=Pseudonocardia ailaonensis TaxID=367279 RepID=A0ABN2MWJ7_9PSEU
MTTQQDDIEPVTEIFPVVPTQRAAEPAAAWSRQGTWSPSVPVAAPLFDAAPGTGAARPAADARSGARPAVAAAGRAGAGSAQPWPSTMQGRHAGSAEQGNAGKKRRRWPLVAAGVAVGFLIGFLVGHAGSGSTTTAATTAAPAASTPAGAAAGPAEPAQAAAPAARAAAPAGPATEASDGTYEVGVDLAAGRYKTAGPPADSIMKMCYWERDKNDSGQFDAIIANEIVQGPGSVTVKQGEFAKLSGGCTWTKV